MVSYQYYLHFPKLQKYSIEQDKSLITPEKRKISICWSEAEQALRKQNKSLYYLDWSKQDHIFKEASSSESTCRYAGPSIYPSLYMPGKKKPETVMPYEFMDLVNGFKFAMDDKEINEIHKSSRLVLDIWNNFKKIKPKAYIIRDDLEELLITSTSYSFSQLVDYLYSCKGARPCYDENYRHSYDRSVDKKLAVSAMLLRFWFGQVSFDSIEKYSKIDKLRGYYRKVKGTFSGDGSIHDFLEAFNIYLDEDEVDMIKEEENKIQKEEAIDRAKDLFRNGYIKSLEELESKDFIDYDYLQKPNNSVMNQEQDQEESIEFTDIIDAEEYDIKEDSIILGTGYIKSKKGEKDIEIKIKDLEEKGNYEAFFEATKEESNSVDKHSPKIVQEKILHEDSKVVGSIRKVIQGQDTSTVQNSIIEFPDGEDVKVQALACSECKRTFVHYAEKETICPTCLNEAEQKAKWTPEKIKESRDKLTNKDTDRYTGAIGEDSVEFPKNFNIMCPMCEKTVEINYFHNYDIPVVCTSCNFSIDLNKDRIYRPETDYDINLKKEIHKQMIEGTKIVKLEELTKEYRSCTPEYSENLTEYNNPEIVGKVRDQYQEYKDRVEESKKQKKEFDKESDAVIVKKGRDIEGLHNMSAPSDIRYILEGDTIIESHVSPAEMDKVIKDNNVVYDRSDYKKAEVEDRKNVVCDFKKELDKEDIIIPPREVIAKKQQKKFDKVNDAKVVGKVRKDRAKR